MRSLPISERPTFRRVTSPASPGISSRAVRSPAAPSTTSVGEGSVWYPGWGGLRFVDMLAGDVITLAADGSLERRHVGSVAAAVRPRRDGGAVIGVERGFALEDADGTLTALPELWN